MNFTFMHEYNDQEEMERDLKRGYLRATVSYIFFGIDQVSLEEMDG